MNKKIVVPVAGIVVLAGAAFVLLGGSSGSGDDDRPSLRVTRASIVDKALAVGTVEPENEISVKSKISGVVRRIFADAGVHVRAGDPLLEVRPDPTPIELAEAKRQLQIRQVEIQNLSRDSVRQEALRGKGLISAREYEESERKHQEAQLQLKLAHERLALMESGRITIEDTRIESIIKAPIDGFVLRKMVEVGDPVTPLTSYQEGTVLMKLANMERLVFKGTVDEIDVGKLREGMTAELKIGALPNEQISGRLSRISLKAEKKDNATVFPIEISLPGGGAGRLRAGYSANANVIIRRKDSVLSVPERIVTFRNDSAFVDVPAGGGGREERLIRTGLSDAVTVEVLEGLKEGDEVLEKPVKQIE